MAADLTPRIPTPEAIQKRWDGLFEALNHEEDRICAIVATSYVEHCLRALLRKRFIDGNTPKNLLDPARGALGQLLNAAALAYSIGLISQGCRETIEKIGTIRNLFAHSIDDVSFAAEPIASECMQIRMPLPKTPASEFSDNDPRSRFMITACLTCTYLMANAMTTEHAKAKKDFWDGAREAETK